jgi:hypothetical protein
LHDGSITYYRDPDSLANSAVMMHGYASLMKQFNLDVGKKGLHAAQELWRLKLIKLSPDNVCMFESWQGDFFNIGNPIWRKSGVVKINDITGVTTILNTGGARAQVTNLLRDYLKSIDGSSQPPLGLSS